MTPTSVSFEHIHFTAIHFATAANWYLQHSTRMWHNIQYNANKVIIQRQEKYGRIKINSGPTFMRGFSALRCWLCAGWLEPSKPRPGEPFLGFPQQPAVASMPSQLTPAGLYEPASGLAPVDRSCARVRSPNGFRRSDICRLGEGRTLSGNGLFQAMRTF